MSESPDDLVLLAPLPGWCTPLDEVPDEVFAGRLMGDGLAIDPTDGTLLAPCAGELIAVPRSAHAVTLRASGGAEILLHIGIDTVGLAGAGFELLVSAGQRVRPGEPLIRFDLDRVARVAKSLITPVVVTDPARFTIVARHGPGRLRAGEALLSIRATAAPRTIDPHGATAAAVEHAIDLALPHGLHARPAALIAHGLRDLRAEITLSLGARTANAKSATAILALGAVRGDRLTLRASGVDAGRVLRQLQESLARALHLAGDPPPPRAGRAARGAPDAVGSGAVTAVGGLALGRATRFAAASPVVPEPGRGAQVERARLERGRARLRQRLSRLAQARNDTEGGILGAHLEFLDDPELLAAADLQIEAGKSAGYAWQSALRQAGRALATLPDPRLAARADDLRDLELQLLELLDGAAAPRAMELPDRAIVIARELLPSQLLALDGARIAGLCTVSGAATSHVAILAAAMGIPMLAGVAESALAIADGTPLLLDADRRRLTIDPAADQVAEAERRIAGRGAALAQLRAAAHAPCRTADGERVEIFANIAAVAEAAAAVAAGAEGCGLLRTELLFLDRAEPPAAEEQQQHYQQVVDAFDGRPVVIRTLDAGGDKPIPFLALPPQDNPALGLRGVRVGLWRPDLLRAQLQAILAVQPAERCRILLPMVNDGSEIAAVRRIVAGIGAASAAGRTPVGVMIETPAAAIQAARLARHADFFSIGTNDLAQYVLAIDRTHPSLASPLDALHPAVLQLIHDVCAAARGAGRPVAVCGALASDAAAAPLLVGLGAVELSALPAAIPAVKEALRRRTLAQCRALARLALEQDSAAAVHDLLVAERHPGDRP